MYDMNAHTRMRTNTSTHYTPTLRHTPQERFGVIKYYEADQLQSPCGIQKHTHIQ